MDAARAKRPGLAVALYLVALNVVMLIHPFDAILDWQMAR
jgi:hypothetical protein